MNQPCSITLLKSALTGSLPADDEAVLHQHLEGCEECGVLLEQMAGGAAWCREAASLLAEGDLGEDATAREDWSAVDFTVDHLEPSDEPNVLGRLGGYDVLEVIGQGGMAIVLKAFDRDLKRCIAVKVLAPHLARNSLARKRFAREAQAAAAVVHANVLAIHQVQPAGRLPFLVMPLVAGESLAQRLTAQGALELKEVLRIGMQAAAGLAAAHEQGLVHRDVKPANILLEKGVERAVLTDFGLARAADDVTLTRWGVIAGTPQYMSPEQARGEPLDGRSDLFSLGCVVYEMATGVSPFRTDTVMATMRRLVDDPPQAIESLNPELPRWFIGIVNRLLEKDPARRFTSAKEVSELLEGCLAHVQQPASVALPAAMAEAPRRRDWRQAVFNIKGVLTMIALLGAALVGGFLLSADPPDIAGEWQGDDWGHVVLTRADNGEFSGVYSDTYGKTPGKIQLKWSRIERRYNGTWHEGDDRFGEISVRLVGDEIRGALTTDAKSKINPATPRLADLKWTRDRPGHVDAPGHQNVPRRAARAGGPLLSTSQEKPDPATEKVMQTIPLRFKLGSEMVDDLRSILWEWPWQAASASDDNQAVVVLAPPDVMKRAKTFITVMDWPDGIGRQPDYNYPRDTVLRAARSFFYACAIEDAPEAFSKLLSPFVLAQLKGVANSETYLDYSMGGTPDPEWEKSLRADWPGKKEAIGRFVREWNRYPLKRITEESGIAIGFGVKHFCSVSFEGAPKDFYSITVEPDRSARGTNNESFFFSSLPPWWKSEGQDRAASLNTPNDATKDSTQNVQPGNEQIALAAEMKKLKGRWVSHSFAIDPQNLAAAAAPRYAWTFDEKGGFDEKGVKGESTEGGNTATSNFKYTLNPTARPKELTITGERLKLLCIYELQGDNLKVAFYGRAELARPTAFTAKDNPPGADPLSVIEFARDAGAKRAAGATLPPHMPFDAWPVFRGDTAGTGVARTTLAEKPELLWKRTFDGGGFAATAAIVDGVVYVGGVDGMLSALDLAGGEVKWQFHAPAALHAAPAVANGMVYIGDVDGELHAVDVADGTEKWSVKSGGEINAGAVFYGNKLLFTSQDGGLYCVDTANGAIEWQYTADDSLQCTPTVAGHRGFLAGCDGKLHIVDLDLGKGIATVEIGEPTLSTPAVMGQSVYFGTMGERFRAVDWVEQRVAWTYDRHGNQPMLSSAALAIRRIPRDPTVADTVKREPLYEGVAVFGGRNGEVHAVRQSDGQEMWSYRTRGAVDSSPVVVGDRVFVSSADGRIYALDMRNGENVWRYEAGGQFLASPAVAQGRLVIGNDAGELFCFGSP